MKNIISLCLFGFLATACVTNKQQDEIMLYSFEADGIERMMQECALINETGDIFQLLAQIKRDVRGVIQVLKERPYSGMEETIHAYAEDIKAKAALVRQLSKEEWNKSVVRHSIKWKINHKYFSRNEYVFEPEVKNVYFQGEERPDLISRVTVYQEANNFVIEYLNKGTLLEYCQLNETLMFVVEIKTGSLKKPKKKLFNLHVNLEN
jgi:hypothetical protein